MAGLPTVATCAVYQPIIAGSQRWLQIKETNKTRFEESASCAHHSTEHTLLSVLHAEASQSTHGSTPRTAQSSSPPHTTHAQHQAIGRCSH